MSTETAVLVVALTILWVLVFAATFTVLWLLMRDRKVRSIHLGFYVQRDRPDDRPPTTYAKEEA